MSLLRLLAVTGLALALLCSIPSNAQQPPAASNPLDVVPDKMPFDVPYGPPITLERSQVDLNTAVAEARKRNWKMSCAVVDSGGNLVALQRMDSTQLASIQISEHKARASAMFRRETKAFEDAVQVMKFYYVTTLDGSIASRGGVPLVEAGKIIGAIGCSGGVGAQDEVTAKAGAAVVNK